MVKNTTAPQLTIGAAVRVPWGLNREVDGTIVEVWGDPPSHVRVRLYFDDADPDSEPVVLLLTPSVLTAA